MTTGSTRVTVKQSLAKLWVLLSRRDRRNLSALCVILIGAALLEVVGIGMVPVFVAAISNPDRVLDYPVIGAALASLGLASQRDLLIGGAVLLLGAFAAKTVYKLFAATMQARFLQNYRVRLSTRLFNAYMQAPYTFHLQRNPAQLLRNANLEVEGVIMKVITPLLTALAQGLIGVAVVSFMLFVQPWVTLVGIGLFGTTSYLFLRVIRMRAMALGRQAQENRGVLIQAVNQGLGGFKEARIAGRESHFVQTYHQSARGLAEAIKHQFVTNQLIQPGLELVAVLGITAVVAVLLLTGSSTSDIVPILALFAAALMRVKQALSQLVTTINQLRYEHVTVHPVHDDLAQLDTKPHTGNATGDKSRRRMPLHESIELRDVSFRYPDADQLALHQINLRIPRGAAIALVGATGAGKSTLADVLLGLLPPEEGGVYVDGADIRTDIRAWQANIGYIPQSMYLLDDTVRCNIAFGVPGGEIDENRLTEAIRIAHLDNLVSDLPDGLDTRLGDRGIRLSGGQRQRICIARAVYHDPDVLVLDEATSALDNFTERRIVEELEAARGDKTLIVIAHRLTTVERCDVLYYLEHGRVRAEGTYRELLETSTGFRQLAQEDANAPIFESAVRMGAE